MKKILKSIFPIEKHELNKFMSFTLMLLFIIVNFNIMRNLKDSLLVANLGAEVISFVKLWLVTPSSILVLIIYSMMCNKFNSCTIFTIFLSVFIGFTFLFAFVIFPNQTIMHPSAESVQLLIDSLPRFKWFFMIYSKWSYAVFYVMAELWGAVIMVLLFWQFANQITTKNEAKRFYPMVALFANAGLAFVGVLMKVLNKLTSSMPNPSEGLIKYAGGFFVVFGVIIIAIRLYSENAFVKKAEVTADSASSGKKSKPKLGLGQSFKMIIKSKYLGLIALLVLGNGISVNLFEGFWKDRVRMVYPDTLSYSNFMSDLALVNAAAVLIFTLVGSQLLRKTSWKSSALITPLMMLAAGGLFFVFGVMNDDSSLFHFIKSILASESLTPAYIAAILGLFLNALIKASKYSVFDATKEMAYIVTNDDEIKTKGKAAVDVVGGRMAKSGGAFIQFTLFTIFPGSSFNDIVSYLIGFFVVVVVAWLYSVVALSHQYEDYAKKHEDS